MNTDDIEVCPTCHTCHLSRAELDELLKDKARMDELDRCVAEDLANGFKPVIYFPWDTSARQQLDDGISARTARMIEKRCATCKGTGKLLTPADTQEDCHMCKGTRIFTAAGRTAGGISA
jgi:hypothetical protein